MTDAELSALARGVRRAIDSNEFEKAGRLWTEYAALVEASLARLGAAARMAEARSLVEHARLTALAFRARSLEKLEAIRVGRRYRQDGGGESRVQFSG